MLDKDFRKRITTSEILEHEYLSDNKQKSLLNSNILEIKSPIKTKPQKIDDLLCPLKIKETVEVRVKSKQ